MPILPPIPDQPAHNAFVIFGPTPAQLSWIVGSIHHDLELIAEKLETIIQSQETLMADFTGLNQALADFKTEVATHATKVDTELAQLLAAQGSGDQAAVDAAAQNIRDQTAALQALDVTLDADDPAVTPPAA